MQVYVLVCDMSSSLFLIAQKRVVNRLWGGKLTDEAVVNQAGQFALPGGKVEYKETAETAARREFLEETGVDLWKCVGKVKVLDFKKFTVVLFETSRNTIFSLEEIINDNIESGSNIKDGELERVLVVGGGVIDHYLGDHVDLPKKYELLVEKQIQINPYSQSIDWYGTIGKWASEESR